ncbi:response regulator transcription factor [soil metagenome]
MQQHSIVITDDHVLIAEALTDIIENFKQYTVLYTAANGKILMERFKQPKNIPDIVLLDINMPEMDGFETAKWLTQKNSEVLILALSMQDDEQTLIKMIKCGAKGYLLKNIHREELEKALDMLVTKGHYYPDWATNKILHNLKDDNDSSPFIKLHDKEIEFLNYSATELTCKEIGEKMFRGARAVESYRNALFEKFNVNTRVGLVVHAIKNGIIKV